ncbi:MAG TPA: TMEM175 family protein [Longimicrobium sp.]|jgi:uncharacterized membrane protein
MIRTMVMAREPGDKLGFRLRGREVSRLEGLSDAVFGFAITLLVVSLEVPRTAAQLFGAMRGFVAFGACFALLYIVWHHHYRFFRRYGLTDGMTETLNAVLLFVVLFFVYPLKFVFGMVIGQMMGDPSNVTLADGKTVPVMQGNEPAMLMVVYSTGYVAVFVIFALLHLHALRKREMLELDELELHDTRDNIRECILNSSIGIASIAVAAIGGRRYAVAAGLVYWLVGPAMAINGTIAGKRRQRIMARVAAG